MKELDYTLRYDANAKRYPPCTPCPYTGILEETELRLNMNVMIADATCKVCRFFMSIDEENFTVNCRADENYREQIKEIGS